MPQIDPKRFEDAEFVLEYFRETGYDPNQMSKRLQEDNVVGVNLLVILSTVLKALDEANKSGESEDIVENEISALDKARERENEIKQNEEEMKQNQLKMQAETEQAREQSQTQSTTNLSLGQETESRSEASNIPAKDENQPKSTSVDL
jgi:hypothetical protein